MKTSHLEQYIERILDEKNIAYIREFQFLESRKYRADFYIPEFNLLLEIEGGSFSGRHNRGLGYVNDIDKYNQVVLAGYKLIRLSGFHIQHGILGALKTALNCEIDSNYDYMIDYDNSPPQVERRKKRREKQKIKKLNN